MKKPTSIAPSHIVRVAMSSQVHQFLIHNCNANIQAGQFQIAKLRQSGKLTDEIADVIQQLEAMIANFEEAKKELSHGKR